jgi:2-phospho-L-lactate transferase/gluconeogenesis factor (CofD/UPF0052 family)
VLSRDLIAEPRIRLTLAINGYDDGLSTGEVRRFLGDCLGPSDFRKNASRLAAGLGTAPAELIEVLDLRFPDGFGRLDALGALAVLAGADPGNGDPFLAQLARLVSALPPGLKTELGRRAGEIAAEFGRNGRSFDFADCSVGNLVFAGCFLHAKRRFNDGVDDYCGLLGLTPGMVDNVTDGANAHLVAILDDGRLLATEAAIVTADQPQRIRDIYLVDRELDPAEIEMATRAGTIEQLLDRHRIAPEPNPRVLERLARADLIIYAPGTQHSSLYPSYFVPGVGAAVARNLSAIKVLITNLREDAEIQGESAVDLINKAMYYLREKGRTRFSAPSLITHYVINDPATQSTDRPYVPLGDVESLNDPRLVRIGNYEEGGSGRHAADRVLTPFVEALLRRDEPIRVGVALTDAQSVGQIEQTLIEMVRAGAGSSGLALTAFYHWQTPIDPALIEALPFEVVALDRGWSELPAELERRRLEFAVLFDSSGMYKGEDVVSLTRELHSGRLDAVWGSRRLSINDIRQAYRLLYRDRWLKGAVSYVGSHLLSLMYLVLYGRYISDTLSGARAIRSEYLRGAAAELDRSDFNHVLLSCLLRRRAEVFEAPVYYFPISPERVRRTTIGDGFRGLATILRMRWARGLSSRTSEPQMVSRRALVPRFGGPEADAK